MNSSPGTGPAPPLRPSPHSPRGRLVTLTNLKEIVTVERHNQSSGAGNKWLIFDQSRKHIETRAEALISPHIQEVLGQESEGYFQGDWSAQGWKIGDRVLPPKGW